MNRGIKLLALFLALVIVAGATVFVKNHDFEAAEGVDEEEEETVYAFTIDADTVTKLSYSKDLTDISLEKTDGVWKYAADSSLELDQEKIEALVSAASSIETEKVIENPDEDSAYGFDEPSCTVDINLNSLIFGNTSEVDELLYMNCGDGKVYLVDPSVTDSFGGDISSLVKGDSVPEITTNLVSFKVESDDRSYEIDRIEDSGLAYSDSYKYFMPEGDGYITLDNELAAEFIENVTYLTLDECVCYNAGDSELKEYGFDNPQAVVTVKYTVQETSDDDTQETAEKEFVIEFSEGYAHVKDSKYIYSVSSDITDKLLYTMPAELLPDEVFALDGTDVTSVTVKLDGKSRSFTKTAETTTNEDGETEIVTSWKENGTDREFGDVLSTVSNMVSYGSASGTAADGEPDITLTFKRSDKNHPETVLSFTGYDSSYSAVSVDGEPTVLVLRSDVKNIIELLESME